MTTFSVFAPLVGIILFFVLGFTLIGRVNSRTHPVKFQCQQVRQPQKGTVYTAEVWRMSRYHGDYHPYEFFSPDGSKELRSPRLWGEVKVYFCILLVLYGCGLLFPTLSDGFSMEWVTTMSVLFVVFLVMFTLWEWHWINKARRILLKHLGWDDEE